MLRVSDLRIKTKNKEIVKGISFTVKDGEIVGIVGESGSGKTLTALSVADLLPEGVSAQGSIELDNDKNMLEMSETELRSIKGDKIGMIFQEPMTSLNPTMRIGRQVIEPLVIHKKTDKKLMKYMAISMLEAVGLEDAEEICNKYPHELSGGMRQRVMIAMAMINEPSLLIADEPTTALDVVVQKQIIDLIKKINEDNNTSVIFITHNLKLVRQFCDKVLVMKDGMIVEQGTPERIFNEPKEQYTRELINAIPVRTRRKVQKQEKLENEKAVAVNE
ncbi:MAG: ABC transporter ATP-binding protein [Lachnospiraceae bacterium]|nr:ABC transporter ATP-binding protein [Lachnospiraceae bacterium]